MNGRRPPGPARPPRRRQLAAGLGALAVVVAVVGGVPLLLTGLHLTPHGVPSARQALSVLRGRDDGQLAGLVLAAAAWVCWGLFLLSLIGETVAVLRARPASPLPGLGVFQRPAAALVAAIAIGFSLTPADLGAPATVRPDLLTATQVELATVAHPDAPGPAGSPAAADTGSPPADSNGHRRQGRPAAAPTGQVNPTYQVRRRDTLWGIAGRHLHDPLRYTEIVALNPASVGPDNQITAGSLLTLPADATGLPPHTIPVGTAGAHTAAVTVQQGDTLWGIEARLTGDGANWPAGWQANRGRPEPDGAAFTDPDLIRPGWTLSIPTLTIPTPNDATRTGLAPAPAGKPRPPAPHALPEVSGDPAGRPGAATAPPPSPRPAMSDLAGAADGAAAPGPGRALGRPGRTATSAPSSQLPMVAFTAGGGLLLAGVTYGALVGYRRRQFRRRRPGRTIGVTPADLVGVERTVGASGRTAMADVTWLDEALRGLAQQTAGGPGGRLPDVLAARLDAEELTLLLAGPQEPAPAPWRVEETGSRWSIRRHDPTGYDPARRGYGFAPYPMLASVGYTDAGEHWLLDLERVGALRLTGDRERCADLARFVAAELAHNSWSQMLSVGLVGFAEELVAANPDRLTYTDDLPGAAAAAGRQLQSATRANAGAGTDVLDGRLSDDDACAPTALLLAPHPGDDTTGLDGLLASITAHAARTGVALVVIGHPEHGEPTGWKAHVDEHGTLSLPGLGVELTAERLPGGEAAQLARMLAVAALAEDQPPPAARTHAPWDTYADACGALTAAAAPPAPPAGGEPPDPHAQPPAAVPDDDDGGTEQAPSPADATVDSVLPLPAQTYLDRAATTQADLLSLAPTVNGHVAGQVRRCDPDLDADLADWEDPACPRPRIGLLGPVQVRAQGRLPERSPQEAFHAEAVACLATRPDGLPVAVYAALMWPADPDVVGKTKVRQSIVSLRKWLGRDPDTGLEYLPAAVHDSGIARYRIVGSLIDAELFRRLRLRGQARGPDGLPDLCRALELVRGRPFTDIPAPREGAPGGYGWLTESNSRLDHEYAAMIVDTAHTVAVAQLGNGQPQQAAQAAQVALAAGSFEDVPLLDLVAASLAQDRPAEAEAYVAQILSNHDADVEEDLPPRTAQVLTRLRRRWVDQAS